MKRILLATLATLFLGQSGCDSGDSKTYEFTGVWMFSGVSELCSQPLPAAYGGGELEISDIRVKVYKKESDEEAGEAPIKTVTSNCEEGSFTVDELKRGSYFIKVEAMAEDPTEEIEVDTDVDASVEVETPDPQTRAYYVGKGEVVVPSKDEAPVEFNMSIGKGSIEVTWDFDQGNCQSEWNNVAQVSIELRGGSSRNDQNTGLLDCTLEGQTYLFDDLAWDVYTVTVTGIDPEGTETHRGSFDAPIEIRPGTEISGLDGIIDLIPIEE